MVLRQYLHEKFLQTAVSALFDGYTREAVASMASAVERLHEHCIQVFLAANKVDLKSQGEAWKRVGSQCERQFGAFQYLFLVSFGSPAPLPQFKGGKSLDWVGFRNLVVHKGSIPSMTDGFAFSESSFNYMRDVLSMIHERHHQTREAMLERDRRLFDPLVEGQPVGALMEVVEAFEMVCRGMLPDQASFKGYAREKKRHYRAEDHSAMPEVDLLLNPPTTGKRSDRAVERDTPSSPRGVRTVLHDPSGRPVLLVVVRRARHS